ncbi:acyltransferase [Telmatobacter sp. DSM 110680]|uniref:Acyltransferase n=1 Tax=Telmatobacter sp. DSM 110680 TaxID=3036704 RepID=A0AAU7DHS6_9BACT
MLETEIAVEPPGPGQPSGSVKPRVHLRYVDGFRGFAALYVVLNHAFLQTWPGNLYGAAFAPQGTVAFMTHWLDFGTSAVTFFIAISGFCLMLPVLGNQGTLGPGGARGFFYHRARRILPPYYAALLLSIGLVATLIGSYTHSVYDASLPMTKFGIFSHFVLIHNLQQTTIDQISAPLWSIAVESQIYLLFPLFVAIRLRLGMEAVLGGSFLLSMVLLSMVSGTTHKGLMPVYIFVFAMGMYAAEVAVGPRRILFVWMGCAAGLLMLGMFFVVPALQRFALSDVVVGVVSMCLLITCGHWPNNPLARVASSKPIVRIGKFSYSLYLVHFPVQQVLWKYVVFPMKLGQVTTFGIMATAGTGLIIIFAYGFYLLFERPFTTVFIERRAS